MAPRSLLIDGLRILAAQLIVLHHIVMYAPMADVARSHSEATRDLTRTFGAVSDYLGLVSLVAIFLAGLGAA